MGKSRDKYRPQPPDYRIPVSVEVAASIRLFIDGEHSLADAELLEDLRAAVAELVADPKWAVLRPEVHGG